MSKFTTKNRLKEKIRKDAYIEATNFAAGVFAELRKNDTCLNRLLRFLRLKK